MSKRVLFAILILVLAFLSGCKQVKTEKRFAEGCKVDDVDLSGKTYAEGKQLIEKKHGELLDELTYTILTDTKSIRFSAGSLGITFNTEETLKNAYETGKSQSSKLIMNEDIARNSLNSIADEITVGAIEASAKYDSKGEFVFLESREGAEPDIDKIISAFKSAIASAKSRTMMAQMKAVKAEGKTLEELTAANSLIAEFTTYFDRSPLNAKGRVHNIIKAAELTNGKTLAPNESFDTNAVLGDRNGENGWEKAAGIRDGKYNQEYGGGVCQLSSTLYNAVLLANLQVVERTHHTWPVTYVDIGRDATISTGGPNFVFKNNTDSEITIAAIADEDKQSLTIKLFGAKPKDYAYTKLYSEQIGTISAPKPEYVYNSRLSAGETVIDRKARNGKKAVTYRIYYDEQGKKLKTERVTGDTYKAIGARVYYGM